MSTYRIEQGRTKDHLTGTMDVIRKNGDVYVRPQTVGTPGATQEGDDLRATCRPTNCFYRTPLSTYTDDYRPYPRDDAYQRFYDALRCPSLSTLTHTQRRIGKNTTTYEAAYQPMNGPSGGLPSLRFGTRCGSMRCPSGTKPHTVAGARNDTKVMKQNESTIDLDRKCIADGNLCASSRWKSTYTHDFCDTLHGYPVGFGNQGINQHFTQFLKDGTWGDGKITRAVSTLH
ncbi:hypothetical protein GMRT_15255 [Giardia muris]|uniref:Uncharacterized protein n=1 Tax=Giardia muris TaxID=5742 RepID=A0A4Z1T6K9_GIAMU|nr:hypothetical protein GMRT_15255 [Giardia muris]|eukprot:TNJ28179.1 hypothetical protein GMRT_15255 [Giardia muris]